VAPTRTADPRIGRRRSISAYDGTVSGDPSETFDLAVIGGGPAGVTAALRAGELGARVALLERDRPGGTCTDDGCAPTRVLAKAARLLRDTEQLAAYGMTGGRPSLDLPALLAATQRTVYELHEKKQLVGHLERAGVRLVRGHGPARFVDAHRLSIGDRTLRAERLIIACGGHARRLAFPGSELALTHSDVWQLRRLPRSLAIVGAAATGVQLASIFAAFGSRVTLLEVAPRIVPSEDADLSAALGEALAANQIEVLCGIAGVEHLRRDRAGLRLDVRLGDGSRELDVDAVILAVGWPGNLEELGLDAVRVRAERGYVTVDDTLRTSVPHIWAAGDVTGRMMLVQSATYEGRIAAENALASTGRALPHTTVAHGGFTDPEYGSVGITEAAAREGGAVVIGRVAYSDLDRAVIDRRTEGFCKLLVDRDTRQVIGAHVIGEQAVEVVQIAATAMAAGISVERLAEVEFAYPTFTSIVGLAARQVVHALRLGGDAAAWEAMGRPRQSEWERRDA
jgi:pyruvate/2-oxoglutarate dehydrogenase complex dihydrolipoamide dehydrogenase (E3) component